jgi:lipopolysaccharide/colanic/teichoic acid biosynthesis glycosyltransferase
MKNGRRRLHQKQRAILILALILNDAICFALAVLLAWYIRIGSGWLAYSAPGEAVAYQQIALFGALIVPVIFHFNHLYDYSYLLAGPMEYGSIVRACTYSLIGLILLSFLLRTPLLSRGWLLASWFLAIVIVGGSRFFIRRFFIWLRRSHGWLITRTLIIGANAQARAIASQLANQDAGIEIIGFLDEFHPIGTSIVGAKEVLGTPQQLHQVARQYEIERVILVSNAIAWESYQEVMEQAAVENGYEIQLSPGYYEILATNVRVTHSAFVPLLKIEQARITGLDKLLKISLDYGLGMILLIVTLPVQLGIGFMITLIDGLPLVERYQVIGLAGKAFWTTKFRTGLLKAAQRRLDMQLPDEVFDSGSKIGRALYKSGLDKLPQLLDVIRGDLSLVGPRTISDEDRGIYQKYLPMLVSVKPGWTGPWAVSGARSLDDEMRLNMYYIRNWTIWLDLQILVRTIRLVITRRSRK